MIDHIFVPYCLQSLNNKRPSEARVSKRKTTAYTLCLSTQDAIVFLGTFLQAYNDIYPSICAHSKPTCCNSTMCLNAMLTFAMKLFFLPLAHHHLKIYVHLNSSVIGNGKLGTKEHLCVCTWSLSVKCGNVSLHAPSASVPPAH